MVALIVAALTIAESKVTFMTRAARAEVVLPALGKAVGVSLQSTSETAEEILVIDVKNVPLSHVLKRIADVTSSKWISLHGSLILEPDFSQRKKQEKDDQAEQVAVAKEYQETLRDQIKRYDQEGKSKPDKPQTPGDEAMDALERSFYKLRAQLFASLNIREIASLKPGERVIFSSLPNGSQKALNGVGLRALAAHLTVRKVLTPKLSKVESTRGVSTEDTKTALFVVYKPDHEGAFGPFSFQLGLYDGHGNLVDQTRDSIFSGIVDYFPSADMFEGTKVSFSEDSWTLLNNSFFRADRSDDGDIGFELGEKLRNPLKYDPLSYFQTDELASLARSEGKPLVADLPDNWVSDPPQVYRLVNLKSVRDKIQSGYSVRRLADREFVCLKPAHPQASRENRLSRHAFQDLQDAAAAKGIPSLDDVCRFVVATPKPEVGLPMRAFLKQASYVTQTSTDFDGWDTLRAFSLLTESQKLEATRSGGLRFGSLDAKQRAAFSHWVMSTIWPIVHDVKDGYKPFEDYPVERYYGMYLPSALSLEPTEVIPQGVPEDARIFLDSIDTPMAVRGPGDGKFPFGRLISTRVRRLESGSKSDATYRIGARRTIRLRIRLTSNIEAETRVFDYRLTPGRPNVSASELDSILQR